MSDCKMPCRKYKEKIDKLTSEVNFLRNVLFTYVEKEVKTTNFKIERSSVEFAPKALRDLVYPPSLQSDTMEESDRSRP